MELSKMEKLAVCQAFVNTAGDLVKTNNPNNLRGAVDAEMKSAYEQMGCKSFDVKVLGQKVGTYSLTISKPKKQKERIELSVEDSEELFAWAAENNMLKVDMDAIENAFLIDGVIPDGCRAETIIEPEIEGGEVTRTTLKVDAKQVARVLGARLEPVAQLLLDGDLDD